ncbi:MAG TPA: tRNA uracil 4-sulfurtransferase ThiI [bacterium]|nr:tRNA uracil 4-sulfurtransferase ThiI [bacterium]
MAHYLLRYGEIALKGENQHFFLEALVRNIRRAMADLGPAQVHAAFGRIIATTDADPATVTDRLRKVFGVVSFSPVNVVSPTQDEITQAAIHAMERSVDTQPAAVTFKVDTRRADKRFPLTSMDTSREVGAAILQRFPHLHARMRGPDVRVQIDIRDHAYVSTETIPGPGGLPVGTGGKALALVSGGIDSPVAAWMGARRGLTVIPVHFHSFPFTSERSKDKVLDLCRVLAEYTGPLRVWIVFFTEIQRAIQLSVPDALRIVVMRRMMLRLADQIAGVEHAQALVTGESLGQVASQTIESIAAINAVTQLPVLRPLVGTDKTEIVSRAEAIGTYAISIRPYEDCCSLFTPAHPRTQPTLEEAAQAEHGLALPGLIAEAIERSERLTIVPRWAAQPASAAG